MIASMSPIHAVFIVCDCPTVSPMNVAADPSPTMLSQATA